MNKPSYTRKEPNRACLSKPFREEWPAVEGEAVSQLARVGLWQRLSKEDASGIPVPEWVFLDPSALSTARGPGCPAHASLADEREKLQRKPPWQDGRWHECLQQ